MPLPCVDRYNKHRLSRQHPSMIIHLYKLEHQVHFPVTYRTPLATLAPRHRALQMKIVIASRQDARIVRCVSLQTHRTCIVIVQSSIQISHFVAFIWDFIMNRSFLHLSSIQLSGTRVQERWCRECRQLRGR